MRNLRLNGTVRGFEKMLEKLSVIIIIMIIIILSKNRLIEASLLRTNNTIMIYLAVKSFALKNEYISGPSTFACLSLVLLC